MTWLMTNLWDQNKMKYLCMVTRQTQKCNDRKLQITRDTNIVTATELHPDSRMHKHVHKPTDETHTQKHTTTDETHTQTNI